MAPLGFARLSGRQYDRMIEAGVLGPDDKVELLHGMLVEMSPQGPEHAALVSILAQKLAIAVGARAIVRSHSPLSLADHSRPEPDVALVAPGEYRQRHPATALLVIEVADSSAGKDRKIKSRLYAAAGIAEYWIVDVSARTVDVLREPGAKGYASIATLRAGDLLQPQAFPDVTIAVAEVFK